MARFFPGMISPEGAGHDGPAVEAPNSPSASSPTHVPSPAVAMFARKLAHDINNFATVVRTYSELLLADIPAGPTRDDVSEIHRASDAMVAYLQRVARFSRTSSLRPTDLALLPIVQSVVAEFADAGTMAPVICVGTTTAQVHVDQTWCRDVLRELVINAREAAPASTTVTVSVSEFADATQTQWTIVDVRDRGVGFPAAIAANAEDPFVTGKDGVRGAGFGLTVAAAFADASQGRLVRSRVHDGDGELTSVALWLRRRDS